MGVVDKIWSFLGVTEEEVEESNNMALPYSQEQRPGNSSNIVSIRSSKTMKVVICEPQSFDEVQMLADHLKSRKQLILNFEKTPPEVAQRLADFLSGTIYALEGQFQQLGSHIYVFAPSNMEFSRDHRTLMRKHNYNASYGGGN